MTALRGNLPDVSAQHGGLSRRSKGQMPTAASTRRELALPTLKRHSQ
jgi:hypothetical protein